MAKAQGGIRQNLSRAAEMAKGVQRLYASGIGNLGNLGVTLQSYKVPRDVVFIDELPHNSTGKLLRRVLTEMDVDS